MESCVLEIESALYKLGNSYKLYQIILQGFLTKHINDTNELRRLVKNKSFKDAQILAHSIKGLCGNLGAEKLRLFAYDLERLYELNQEDALLLDQFEIEHAIVINEITRLLEFIILEITEDVEEPKEFVKENGQVDELLRALESFEYSRISCAFEALRTVDLFNGKRNLLYQVGSMIEQYQYLQAKELLQTILKTIQR